MEHYVRSSRKYGSYLLASTILFILGLFSQSVAQDTPSQPIYVGYVYIKTEPGKFNSYDSLVRTYTKKVFDDEIKAGNYISWQMFEVLSPTGTQAEYDIVGVALTNKIEMLLDPPGTDKERFAKSFPKLNAGQVAAITKGYAASRTIVKREIYTLNSSTDMPAGNAPPKYVQVDFMTPMPGKGTEYAKMETDVFKPVHNQRMKLGALRGWALLQKILPGDSEDPSPYVTVNFYDNFAGMMDGKYEEAIKAAHPNSDINKLFNEIGTVKKRQRIEVWKLMVSDSKPDTAAK